MVHGNSSEEVKQDLESIQTIRALGKNMAFLMKSIKLVKNNLLYLIKKIISSQILLNRE
ncbi:hypothetical protein GNF77_14695 [Clostridium perfringens]|uniref:Uncharacterized protein n=1 Tax=Clostridium perfringens TaxID=1502 RepID=A0AAW9ISS9_CLOPF|nr:hypothetical protein [Clostridium perfringens]